MEFLNDYLNLIIVGLCLLFGFIVKKWIKDVDNKFIPTLVTALGIALAVWMNWGDVTAELILGGGLSGLASTGLHQLFKQWIDNTVK